MWWPGCSTVDPGWPVRLSAAASERPACALDVQPAGGLTKLSNAPLTPTRAANGLRAGCNRTRTASGAPLAVAPRSAPGDCWVPPAAGVNGEAAIDTGAGVVPAVPIARVIAPRAATS